MNDYSVTVNKATITEEYYQKCELILRYRIEYPKFASAVFVPAVNKMNRRYQAKAFAFKQYCEHVLLRQAMEQYKESTENNFPVRAFDVVLSFIVTYNQDCALSLYFDRYIYSGGAHGNTLRDSDTWDLKSAMLMAFRQFFPAQINATEFVLTQIKEQIADQKQHGYSYFPDHESLAEKYLSPSHFYLVPEGMKVYFQQYEIAPYSSGIVEFLLPFGKYVIQPQCRTSNR